MNELHLRVSTKSNSWYRVSHSPSSGISKWQLFPCIHWSNNWSHYSTIIVLSMLFMDYRPLLFKSLWGKAFGIPFLRDIGPSNIMIRKDGRIKLLDFGAARELEEDNKTAPITDRALYTTKGFTAPECLTKNDGTLRLSPAADLYSAGCVFLRLLSGRHISHQALELVTNGRYIYSRQAVKLRCPDSACDAINRFLDRALKKNPEERYQSAEEMLQDAVKIEQSLAPANIPISTSEYAAFISYCHSDKTNVAAQLLADSL